MQFSPYFRWVPSSQPSALALAAIALALAAAARAAAALALAAAALTLTTAARALTTAALALATAALAVVSEGPLPNLLRQLRPGQVRGGSLQRRR